MKFLFTFIVLLLSIGVFSQNTIQIEQIKSDEQIRLGYDTVRNSLNIFIPLEYQVVYKNKIAKKMWIITADHYVPDEYGTLGLYGGWLTTSIKLKMENRFISHNYGWKNALPDTCYYRVGTIHTIQQDNDIQDSLAMYIQQIRSTKIKSLSVGTLNEFKKEHPQLVHRLLKNDSIGFRIAERPRKYIKTISMPVKY